MTLYNFKNPKKKHYSRKDYDSLRPPLTFREILIDLKAHWHRYALFNLSMKERIILIGLSIIQRISYNLGWLRIGLSSTES